MDLQPSVLVAFFFLGGVIFGSFGNVLLTRLPSGESIAGRSRCPGCRKLIRASDLVPIVSFLWLRGKCRNCSMSISLQYPLIELLSGVLAVAVLLLPSHSVLQSVSLALACWMMFLIAIVDGRTGFIPDAFSFPFVLLAILYGVLTPPIGWAAAIVAGGFFGAQWAISGGRWVGSGDIPLAVGIGFLMHSVPFTIMAIFGAYILGAIVALLLIGSGKKTLQSSLPFGPFLVIGAYVTLFAGDGILALLL